MHRIPKPWAKRRDVKATADRSDVSMPMNTHAFHRTIGNKIPTIIDSDLYSRDANVPYLLNDLPAQKSFESCHAFVALNLSSATISTRHRHSIVAKRPTAIPGLVCSGPSTHVAHTIQHRVASESTVSGDNESSPRSRRAAQPRAGYRSWMLNSRYLDP